MSHALDNSVLQCPSAPRAAPPESAGARYNLLLLRPIARWCRATRGDDELRQLCREAGVPPEWFAANDRWVSWQQFEAVLAAARARVASDEEFIDINVFEYAETYRYIRLMTWAITPSLTYRGAERLGGYFSSAGHFTFEGSTHNSARLRWTSACPESRLVCLSRQAQAMYTPTLWGMPRAHVREYKCIARGDDCCEYEFFWLSRKRALPAIVGGGAGLAGVVALTSAYDLAPAIQSTIPLLGVAAGYLYEFRRVDRANSATQTEIADAFRDVLADAAQAHRKASELEERLRTAERAAARVDTFIGRERELATLRTAFHDAVAGRGRLMLVSGEAGIGKTRLAEEFASYAESQGARFLLGRCHQGEGTPALWPWVQIIRNAIRGEAAPQLAADVGAGAADIAQLVPELREQSIGASDPPLLETLQARFRLFDSVTRFLRAVSARRVVALVLDDLQWADHSTLLLLQFLVSQIRDARVLVVGAYREGELGSGDLLTQALPDLMREPGCEAVALGGLAKEQLAPFIGGITGTEARDALTDAVYEITEGNPFFTREVVRLLASEGDLETAGTAGAPRIGVPQSVREVVQRRLGRLSADCHRLLEVGAVIGRDFVLDRAGLVAGLDRRRLLEVTEEALAARVLRGAAGGQRAYSFLHAVIREVLYDGIPASRRSDLHGRIATAMEQVAGDEPSANMTELAHHYCEAADAGGSVDKAVEYCRRAGDAASRLGAYDAAIRFHRRALDFLAAHASSDERVRCELLLALGEAQMRGGDAPGARERSLQAAALARRLGLPEHFARAALGFGWWFRLGVVDEERIELLTAALASTGDGDSPLKARLMARLATEQYWIPDSYERRAELSAEAVAMARRVQDSAALAFALNARLYALWVPGAAELRLPASQELLQLAQSARDTELALHGRQWVVTDLMELGDAESAYREMGMYARQAEALHQPLYLWFASVWRAMRALLEGRLNEVEPLAQEALTLGLRAEPENAQRIFSTLIFWLRREQGRLGEFVEVMAPYANTHSQFGTAYGCGLALTYAELGREAEARQEFNRLVAVGFASLQRELPLAWLEAIAAAAEACSVLRDPHAAELYDLLVPFAGRNLVEGMAQTCLGSVSRHLGLLATTLRRWAEADEHFRDALAMHERLGARPLLARTRHDCARMLVARDEPGDRAQALQLLELAVDTARELGMQSLIEKALSLHATVNADPLRLAADSVAEDTAPTVASVALLRHEGDYWTLEYDRVTGRLKDSKGLHYLAHLLKHPGQEFHILDLIRSSWAAAQESDGSNPFVGPLRAGLEVLDAMAKAAYKRRLTELREELEEAERFNDQGRAASARHEMEAIAEELAAAVGLGGRDRQAASATERARSTATQRIRTAIKKIDEHHPLLGYHLARGVKTGAFCVYQPDPARPIIWDL